jgi:hypothetical protein
LVIKSLADEGERTLIDFEDTTIQTDQPNEAVTLVKNRPELAFTGAQGFDLPGLLGDFSLHPLAGVGRLGCTCSPFVSMPKRSWDIVHSMV